MMSIRGIGFLIHTSAKQSTATLRIIQKTSYMQPIRMHSTIKTIFTDKSYAPIGHYSQAFAANGQVWVAG
ncbi:hypothetical protein F4805DRAFT_436379 [Annulohypoxylon moriforme]|nr:hypothetical protein F4805DRAFT_436379 [Annulohypoxylon moriforme]